METARTLIRPLTFEDVEDIFEMYSDKEAMKYRANPPLETKGEAIAMIRAAIELGRTTPHRRLAVVEKSSQKVIGTILYKKVDDGVCEIGYSFHKAYWGQGFATEVLLWLIAHLYKARVHTLQAQSMRENEASIKLLLRAGFVEEDTPSSSRTRLFRLGMGAAQNSLVTAA